MTLPTCVQPQNQQWLLPSSLWSCFLFPAHMLAKSLCEPLQAGYSQPMVRKQNIIMENGSCSFIKNTCSSSGIFKPMLTHTMSMVAWINWKENARTLTDLASLFDFWGRSAAVLVEWSVMPACRKLAQWNLRAANILKSTCCCNCLPAILLNRFPHPKLCRASWWQSLSLPLSTAESFSRNRGNKCEIWTAHLIKLRQQPAKQLAHATLQGPNWVEFCHSSHDLIQKGAWRSIFKCIEDGFEALGSSSGKYFLSGSEVTLR